MPPRKRNRAEMEAPEPPKEKKEPSLLQKIRNTWEFSAVMQYIYLFGKVVKIDEDFDVEDFEEECLKPGYSEKLEEIGLTLLKWISSHRGLTYDIWDEYVRRQYVAKAPERNPYGEEEEPNKFRNFDIFQKIRVLHQLTVWTFWNPDRVRERMPEHQKEIEQTEWRMEPFGWDSEEREYYVLDDNRMYRRTEPPLPITPKAKPKANTIKARAARRRASKRQRLDTEEIDSEAQDEDEASQHDSNQAAEHEASAADTFGGYTWECVAITLNDFNDFIDSIKKTRDPNEKNLRQRIIEDVLPIIEAAAEKQRRKQERRERELMLLERMAGAKRSSRLAGKQEREKREQEEAEAARKKAADLAAAHREQDLQEKMEEERRSRMMTREQRIKDREYKRLLKEEELARDAEEARIIEEGGKRGSERQLKDRIEKNKRELEELEAEEDWSFDCSGCGKHGKNYDDGSHSVACEKCNVWQHSKCLGISKSAADKPDFHFVCSDCQRKEEEAKRPKIMLKFGSGGPSSSPTQQPLSPVKPGQPSDFAGVDIPVSSSNALQGSLSNGVQHIDQPTSMATQSSSTSLTEVTPGFSQSFGPTLPDTNSIQPTADSSTSNLYAGSTIQSGATVPYSSHTSGSNNQSTVTPPIESTPRPTSGYGFANGPSHTPGRLPSPVINRPTISPTQGNPEVGPIAGVPGSGANNFQPTFYTPSANGNQDRPQSRHREVNGDQHQQRFSSPNQSFISRSPNAQQLSGLSPTKQRVTSALPPPSNIPEKTASNVSSPRPSNTLASSFNTNASMSFRSISGTPIFPPAENLAPSPEQVNREPVPTPSKQASPIMISGDPRRVSGSNQFQPNGVNHPAAVTEPQPNTRYPVQTHEAGSRNENGQQS